MADHGLPQARKGILDRNKWVLFTVSSILMVLVTLWLMFVHVNKEGLLYPHEKWLKMIPNHWLQRAIIYNTYNSTNNTYTEITVEPYSAPYDDLKLVCYYNFPDTGSTKQLIAKHIDPHLCTHINIAFAVIVNNSIYLTKDQIHVSKEILDLRLASRKKLQVLLSVGGAGNDGGFSKMVVDHANRKTFIESIMKCVREYKFDGVDLDWEYPGIYSPSGKERMHFTQLLREIRAEINRQTRHKFLLSVAVAAPKMIIDVAYDVSYMNEYVDFINVMSYDYHFYTKATPYTGMNSPLYAAETDVGYFAALNINYTAHYWWQKGMNPRKIVIGLPAYAHTYKLLNKENTAIGAPAIGYGSLGHHGFASFHDFCLFIKKNKVDLFFDATTKSPYATKYDEWISFDDIHSLEYKTKFIKESFGGAMIYALNTDDHMGICYDNQVRFPLTRQVKKILDEH